MGFLIINNDEYKMNSIDKLHYMFQAGQSHNKWDKLNFQHEAAMGFESFVPCEFVVHQKAEAMYAFRSQSIGKNHISTTCRYTGETSGPVLSFLTTGQALHIWQSHFAIISGEAVLSFYVRI